MKKLTPLLLSSLLALSTPAMPLMAQEVTSQQAAAQTVDLSALSQDTVLNGNSYILSGTTTHNITIDAQGKDVSLVLSDASITTSGPALLIQAANSVSVEVSGTNALTSSVADEADYNAALYSMADTTLSGTGSLSLNAPNAHGINCKGTMTISGVSLSTDTGKDGIHTNEDLTINSGTFSLKATDEGIQSAAGLTISGGTFTINSVGDCLRAETDLLISEGTFSLNSSENEGIESKDNLTISGGTFTINTYDDCINAANALNIKGGTIRMTSQTNDCADSNGTLSVSGGNITAIAVSGIEGAFDTDNTPFTITGGTILAVSGGYTAPTSITQNAVLVGEITTLNSVQITSGSSVLFEKNDLNVTARNASVFVSSPDLKTGSEINVLINNASKGTLTLKEGVNQIGNVNTGPGGAPGGNPGDGTFPGPGPVIENPYSDVTTSDWYYQYAMRAYEYGLMSGSNGLFNPSKDLSRADFCLVLYRLAGSPTVDAVNTFVDVPEGAYYKDAVLWANSKEVMMGTETGVVFSPSKNITRQNFVTALSRYLTNVEGKTLDNLASISDYPDAAAVADYALKPMQWAVGNGLIKGIEIDGTYYLEPNKAANRAESAKMFVVFYDSIKGIPQFPGNGNRPEGTPPSGTLPEGQPPFGQRPSDSGESTN